MKTTNRTSRSGVHGIKQLTRMGTEACAPALRLLLNPKTLAQLPRLLTEGMGPVRRMFIQAHNAREIRKLIAENVPITFVTSFARSGNTWMRYLLSDVFLQQQGIETSTNLVIPPDEIIADMYCNLIATRNKEVRTPGVLVKTHEMFSGLRRSSCGGDAECEASFQRCRHLYLCRSPEDSLVSLHHLLMKESYFLPGRWHVKSKSRKDIDTFCRDAMPEWIRHVSSYLEAAENGAPVFFVSYEHLLAEPAGVLGEVLRWLGVPFTQAILQRAASNMDFQKLKAVDPRTLGNQPPILRYGRNGRGAIELQPSTIDYIREGTSSLVERLQQLAARPPAPPGIRSEFLSGSESQDASISSGEIASIPKIA
jgi:hypothetical protein